MLRSLLSERTQLEISLSQDPVPILVDVTQLEVVLMNLAINAHDAMPDGGVFLVATGKEDRDSKPLAVLTVADSGKGMPPEVQERIFEPFFTTKAMGKGTGLGLSTVYGIVERAGGTIEVQSQPNEGTQFRIYLPSTQEVYRADTSTPVSPEGGSETILLAEDEAGIRTMTKAYLEGLGYKVLDATDGADAVEVSTGYSGIIDLLVTDVLMPRMRGDVLFHTLRKKRPYIKVLYISGFEGDSGADEPPEVLLKPFEFPELGQRVRSILDSKPALKSRMKKPA
jgi:CheY-like chemotaxis protein